jgi:hypothetical protein
MIRVGVHEETKDKFCCFYSRLRTEIQDIVDYKEYNDVNHLFQIGMLAKKELQGHQLMKMKTSSPAFLWRPPHPIPARARSCASFTYWSLSWCLTVPFGQAIRRQGHHPDQRPTQRVVTTSPNRCRPNYAYLIGNWPRPRQC